MEFLPGGGFLMNWIQTEDERKLRPETRRPNRADRFLLKASSSESLVTSEAGGGLSSSPEQLRGLADHQVPHRLESCDHGAQLDLLVGS